MRGVKAGNQGAAQSRELTTRAGEQSALRASQGVEGFVQEEGTEENVS